LRGGKGQTVDRKKKGELYGRIEGLFLVVTYKHKSNRPDLKIRIKKGEDFSLVDL